MSIIQPLGDTNHRWEWTNHSPVCATLILQGQATRNSSHVIATAIAYDNMFSKIRESESLVSLSLT
ncbi:hypothetical protein DPV78_012505 [Talaromyces pinophilus]|nr:hypothetical protein DPV78_012505 [Talaromyces pinophilus]